MAKDLDFLEAATRTLLDEQTQADWTDVEVAREVNLGYMKAFTEVVNVYEDYYTTTANEDFAADTQEYSLPTDLYKLRRVEANYAVSTTNSVGSKATFVKMDSILRDLGNSAASVSTSSSPAYYVIGTTIGFLPIPDSAGTNAIKFWYVAIPDELSDGEDEINIPFPDRYYESIPLEAAGNLLRKGQQEEEVALAYLADAENRREKMSMELEDRIADGPKSIIDISGESMVF